MVELFVNNERVDLFGNETIAVDYSIAQIGNFATRNGFRSVNFSVAKTANNRRIFESSEEVNNLTLKPYRRLSARILQDGIDQNIRFCDIERTNENYNLRLYGGNADFFDLIKNRTINQLSYLPSLSHEQNLTNIFNSRTNNDGYIYPLIDFHADSPNAIITNNNKSYDVRYCYPCIFFDEMLEYICSDVGYTLQNNLLNDSGYQSAKLLYFPAFANQQFFNGNSRTESNVIQNSILESPIYYAFPKLLPVSGEPILSELGTWTTDGALSTYPITVTDTIYFYQIPVSGEYTFELNGRGAQTLPVIALILKRNGSTLEEITSAPATTGPATWEINLSYTVNATAGEEYVAYYLSLTPFTIENSEYLYLSNVVNFNLITSKLKQSDFLKGYVQMFSSLVTADENTKTVFINKFDEIADNISDAIDWSNKIDYSKQMALEFEFDKYAQQNNLLYKEDNSVEKPTGTDGVITVDDETLPGITDLWTLPFAATQMVTRLEGLLLPQIKIFTTNDNSPPETLPTEKVENRVLLLNRETITDDVIYTDGSTTDQTNTNLPFAYFILDGKVLNLGFGNNLIPLYFNTLESVLTRTKIVTENIRLNSVDILNLDFMKPIFLQQHNAYFYISKIKNYSFGKTESTEVELVKIR